MSSGQVRILRMAASLPGGRGRGRPTADDQGGAKGAEAEVERLVEGDVGREEVGGGRGGGEGDAAGAGHGEEEHQLRAIRCLEEGEPE